MWALLRNQRQYIERELMEAASVYFGEDTDDFNDFVIWMSDLTDRALVEVAVDFVPGDVDLDIDYFDVVYNIEPSIDGERVRRGDEGCYQRIRHMPED